MKKFLTAYDFEAGETPRLYSFIGERGFRVEAGSHGNKIYDGHNPVAIYDGKLIIFHPEGRRLDKAVHEFIGDA